MRFLAVFMVMVLALSVLSACGKKKTDEAEASATPKDAYASLKSSDKVATYKDGSITKKELDTFIGVNIIMDSTGQVSGMLGMDEYKDYMRENLLKQLVVWKVLEKETSDANKKEGDKQAEELQKQVDGMKGDQKKNFESALKEANVKVADLKNYVAISTAISMDFEAKVTDADAQAAYDNNVKTNPNFYEVVDVRHILVGINEKDDEASGKVKRTKEEALARAKEVKAKLDAGGDFAELAKTYSEDGNKDSGGLYAAQQIGTSSFVEPFLKAMTELEVNKISEPVETQFGYHVMRVDSRKTLTFDETKAALKSEKAQSKLSDFVEKDFPAYNFVSSLPKTAPSPSPSTAPSTAPSGSTSPEASSEASPSPASK
jgi:foldase protein PrsA